MRPAHRTVPWVEPARAFAALYGSSPHAFWLDSSPDARGSRFSFMGDAAGPHSATISYDLEERRVTVRRGEKVELLSESIFDYLERELERLRPAAPDLPFDFTCGFAGYLGYELKAECGAGPGHRSELPDAAFVFADRLLAFDHDERCLYLLALGEAEAEEWVAEMAGRLAAALPAPQPGKPTAVPELSLARGRERYLADIAACKERLGEGESYEICLTNTVEGAIDVDPLDLYMDLRRANPAPFASFLRFGDLAVLSSSPERFLRVDRAGSVETKPIKGTAPRGGSAAEDARLAEELRTSEKNRAENLMIVDLMRNDLGSVCEVGSVEVPVLMEVESYETVHQLVSTVHGRLRSDVTGLDCVRACFPPGSMTGAPKLRTMEILEELEGRARGVYSGALGYFGLGGGFDLSVAIRTIVLAAGEASIGAGGAITLQSHAQTEFDEALLKAHAPMRAFGFPQQTAVFSPGEPSFQEGP